MDRRNIVLITLDSVRADHCSFMGYSRETTPTLDKMVRKGLVFENAISPAPRTLFSMAQTFTGKHVMFSVIKESKGTTETENARLHLRSYKTIPEKLLSLGYSTGAFCPNAYTSRFYEFDKGFNYFQDFLFTSKYYQKIFSRMVKGNKFFTIVRNIRNLILKQEAFRLWESYYDSILSWVDSVKEPFFLWVFSLDTHLPWLIPKKFRKWINIFDMYYYNFRLVRMLDKKNHMVSNKIRQKLIDMYDNSIYYADKFINKLSKDLSDYNPVFIVHSDHGEEFGDRGYYGHFYPHFYEENIHVPLIIYNADEGCKISEPFSSISLHDLVLELAKGNINSIVSNLDGNKKIILSKDFYYVDSKNYQTTLAVRVGNWKFILGTGNTCELYNLDEDRYEQENVIKKYPKIAEGLKKFAMSHVRHETEIRKIREKVLKLSVD